MQGHLWLLHKLSTLLGFGGLGFPPPSSGAGIAGCAPLDTRCISSGLGTTELQPLRELGHVLVNVSFPTGLCFCFFFSFFF